MYSVSKGSLSSQWVIVPSSVLPGDCEDLENKTILRNWINILYTETAHKMHSETHTKFDRMAGGSFYISSAYPAQV